MVSNGTYVRPDAGLAYAILADDAFVCPFELIWQRKVKTILYQNVIQWLIEQMNGVTL